MVVDMTEETRICNRCGISKYLYEFRKYNRPGKTKTEYRTICLDCDAKAQRVRYNSNPEKYKQIQKEYTKRNPEKVTKTTRKYRSKNRDKLNKHHLEWINADINRAKKIWCANTIYNHSKRGHIIEITKDELFEMSKHSAMCPICGTELRWTQGNGYTYDSPTLDRIDNESILSIENIWIICTTCNNHKSNKPFNKFIEYCRMVVEKFG